MKQKIAMAEQSFLMLFHRMHDTMTLFRAGNGRMTIHTMCFWRTWYRLGAKDLLSPTSWYASEYCMMPGSKGQKAVHACMIRLLNLGPAKHEEGVICIANQRIPNVCRIAGAACCGAIRGHQLGAKDLLTPTSWNWFMDVWMIPVNSKHILSWSPFPDKLQILKKEPSGFGPGGSLQMYFFI